MIFSHKITVIYDWNSRLHSRIGSNNSLNFCRDLHRRFHISLSSEESAGNFFFKFTRLVIFYNEESSIVCAIHPAGVVLRGVIEQ